MHHLLISNEFLSRHCHSHWKVPNCVPNWEETILAVTNEKWWKKLPVTCNIWQHLLALWISWYMGITVPISGFFKPEEGHTAVRTQQNGKFHKKTCWADTARGTVLSSRSQGTDVAQSTSCYLTAALQQLQQFMFCFTCGLFVLLFGFFSLTIKTFFFLNNKNSYLFTNFILLTVHLIFSKQIQKDFGRST